MWRWLLWQAVEGVGEAPEGVIKEGGGEADGVKHCKGRKSGAKERGGDGDSQLRE